ncbi:unnamed protein product, partial [Tetraodon nigroviridis]
DLRPLPDVAMTGTCTRECSEVRPLRRLLDAGPAVAPPPGVKGRGQAVHLRALPGAGWARAADGPTAAPSPPPPPHNGQGGGSKVGGMRFMAAYGGGGGYGGGDPAGKDCGLEEIPLSQGAEFPPGNTPAGQTAQE